MTRQEKYPDTDCFKFYNANPHNRIGGDCVIRALCTAMEQSWEQTVRELTEVGLKKGYVLNDKSCYTEYLKQKGWVKQKQPRFRDNTKMTGEQFCERTMYHRCIAHIGGHHVVAIMDGVIHDIWDSSDGCVGNYWIKPEEC